MTTAVGRRAIDLAFFLVGLLWLFETASDLRVYHEATPTRISLEAVAADGVRAALATPEPLARVYPSRWAAKREIRAFVGSEASRGLVPPGAQLEWTLHFSRNSPRMDRTAIVDLDRAER